MKKFLVAATTYGIANAAAILFAAIILGPGFEIGFLGFLMAVVIFTAVQAIARPILEKLAAKNLPQIMGSISLITVFVGLWITDMAVSAMSIDGLSNWLAATLIVWLVSLIVEIALPHIFKSLSAASE
ncbi:phage holin family protein [Tabrizicola sp. J26]|uniref:phage holin family protein n=1 Tax=Alitabrizicola rongguiensis TaxID=2909234 RepID=UPI001F287BEE|nr:phage holin family protein [Tabrizicola rongguiensis]MCF1707254.1 phage holin family protein [Tabrizicola rongguiensis]